MSGSGGSTTPTIRAPERALAVALLAAALALPARGDLVVLTNGSFLKVNEYRVRGHLVDLELAEGGRMTVSIELVDRAIADEVLEREPESAPAEVDPGFSVRFVTGHSQPQTPYGGPIWEAAYRHGLNPELLAAVAWAESRFDPGAVSHKGARGLLQLMPSTGKRFGLKPRELFDPWKNLDAGARYLAELADRFQNDLSLVLAAYNAGEGAVARHGGVPPYRETLTYLAKIYERLGLTSGSSGT